jgi:hypothetical protein
MPSHWIIEHLDMAGERCPAGFRASVGPLWVRQRTHALQHLRIIQSLRRCEQAQRAVFQDRLLCGLQIDDDLKGSSLLNGQVTWSLSLWEPLACDA